MVQETGHTHGLRSEAAQLPYAMCMPAVVALRDAEQ